MGGCCTSYAVAWEDDEDATVSFEDKLRYSIEKDLIEPLSPMDEAEKEFPTDEFTLEFPLPPEDEDGGSFDTSGKF
jgi:hypothetical protein